ncbi:MAG: phosphoribosylamine--glycine ligase [Firmicutes bacterium]|nr:phosphoribosylamine--glycine ligase [Bacillota bacterium]
MKVLVVGSGGREHALTWKLARDPRVRQLFAAPGNAGITEAASCVPVAADDPEALADFAAGRGVDLTVVGPETPLMAGIADLFAARGLRIFGPAREAAVLEGSKIFAKEFMARHGIPTAPFRAFDSHNEAQDYLGRMEPPVVVKADGLAAGKGVVVARDREEAAFALRTMMVEGAFGEAGRRVVIEDCLEGQEVSVFGVTDGERVCVLPPCQDHKALLEGDQGPNTGGMGAYCPAPILDEPALDAVREKILEPVVDGMAREGRPFRGVLYAGLMLTAQGPMVLEFNVRFGDPETQALLPCLGDDFLDLLLACSGGGDGGDGLPSGFTRGENPGRHAVCVVLASEGYPGPYRKGIPIDGLEEARGLPGVTIFHAGTAVADGRVVTSGGRVLGVTAAAGSLAEAVAAAYRGVDTVRFTGVCFRRDIARKGLEHLPVNSFRSGNLWKGFKPDTLE